MNQEEKIMREVFKLASNGIGYVEPNPLVGAIIIKNGQIISTGYHRYFGGPHAEIEAINKAPSHKLRKSALFVNLEPCCHSNKKTPPCLQKILTTKFKEIYISNIDPNPKVHGKSIKILKEKGYKVKTGILEKEGKFLNRAFFKSIKEKMPYIVLKSAITYDNKIGILNKKITISSPDALYYAKQSRDEFNAILIGANTLTIDNPFLLSLYRKLDIPKTFYRIVITTNTEQILFGKKIVRTANEMNPIILARIGTNINVMRSAVWSMIGGHWTDKQLSKKINNVKTIKVQDIHTLLTTLYLEYIIGKLLVEGGGETFRSFYHSDYFDEIHLYLSNKIIPDKNALYLIEKNKPYEEFTKNMILYEIKEFSNTKLLKFIR